MRLKKVEIIERPDRRTPPAILKWRREIRIEFDDGRAIVIPYQEGMLAYTVASRLIQAGQMITRKVVK